MATTLLKSTSKAIVKVGVATGAVLVTVNQGIWSTERSQGPNALTEAKGSIRQYAQKMPSTSPVSCSVTDTWNSGVKYVFTSLAAAPDNTKWAADSVKNSLMSK